MRGLRFTTNRDSGIQFYNSATQQKEQFKPLKRGRVTMYACGPTVYDTAHIGNLRAYILPDLVHRLLLAHGYTVNFTMNATDFGHLTDDGDAGEDKIMKGMRREGYDVTLENMRTFTTTYVEAFLHDLKAVGNLSPTHFTRASDYVKEQVRLITTLVQKGYAYETSDGVYFDISTFPKYGILGNVDVEALRSGARVDANLEKRHPADFALWKKADLGWESKWGRGFPGWHIECTAMAFATLGKQIDIHTGGEDLKYTHHNGEIAQAECITHKQYVQYWLHNAHVNLDGEKLAKSTGTMITLQDLIDEGYHPYDYRYLVLSAHYRSPLSFSYTALSGAQEALNRIKRYIYEDCATVRATQPSDRYIAAIQDALDDDLNTPQALTVLFEILKDEHLTPEVKLATFHAADAYLGLGLAKTVAEGRADLGYIAYDELPADIATLLDARTSARAQKKWDEADAFRDRLRARGYRLEDLADGVRVRKCKPQPLKKDA